MRRKRTPIVEAVLRKARRAALAHDWARASAQYDLFWEVSRAARGMAGVRFSYGLMEWAKVGASYPPALERMQELLRDSASKFERTGDWECLMETRALDDALGSHEALDLTLRLHAAKSPHTGNAVSTIWRELVEAGHEAVVGTTMADLEQYYRISLRVVDANTKLNKRGFRDDVVDFGQEMFRENVRLLVRVLEASGRDEARAALEERARSDAESRGFSLDA